MVGIKSIELINFQSHENSKLNLDQGLNVITGPSDQGKSAIIRALRWVLYNEPRGSDFIRHGKKKCQVGIELSNGFKIIRKRTPSKNRYILITPEGEEHVFEKVGSGVPEEILEIHGMRKIYLGTDDETTLNIDYQLEGAFLLTDSGSIRAKTLGRLINVHVVDVAIQSTTRDIKRNSAEQNQLTELIAENEEKLKEFENLNEIKDEIDAQKKLLLQLKNIDSKLERLKCFKDRKDQLACEQEEIEKILKQLNDLDKLESIYLSLADNNSRLDKLASYLKIYKEQQTELNTYSKILDELEGIDELFKVYEELESTVDRLRILDRYFIEYKKQEHSIKVGSRILEELEDLDKVEDIFKLLSQESNKLSYLIKYHQAYRENIKGIAAKQRVIEASKDVSKVIDIVDKELPYLLEKAKTLVKVLARQKEMRDEYKREYIQAKSLAEIDKADEVVALMKQEKIKLAKLLEFKEARARNLREMDQLSTLLAKQEDKVNQLAQAYGDYLKEEGRCPTCLSVVDENVIEHILEEIKSEE
ncbi:exonuclease SbcC [Orenia metallireducens]|uniref:Nuclease SbcCD subunit C n=1 Tax=Orenia metallireducens TaxID=1413210 RepID=A0A285HV93_9FIRM|nr:AAA family ATPase [Orenia metallireducens]PRX31016.1 exonuclease SbcC [Orenia metallireducens]SNY39573.1 exonuclease SbcC [Orenia metallireducens]